MAAALGHGHGIDNERLMKVREILSRIFYALPKNTHDRVERPMLRYALHRYFAQRYSIYVKGLEPTRNVTTSRPNVGAEILLDNVPSYAESLLEGRFADHGFGLDDAVVMATTLEQLILASGTAALEMAYTLHSQSTEAWLRQEELEE